jgi:hypothetical protein
LLTPSDRNRRNNITQDARCEVSQLKWHLTPLVILLPYKLNINVYSTGIGDLKTHIYYRAAGQTVTKETKNLVICYC